MSLQFDANAIALLQVEGEDEPVNPSGLAIPRKEAEVKTEETETKELETETKEEEEKERTPLGGIKKETPKEEPKSDNEEEEVPETESAISQIKKSFDIEFTDENGKEIEFDNSIESVTKLTEIAAEKLASKRVEAVFDEFPEAYDLILHLKRGGSVNDFASSQLPDFSTVKLDSNNDNQLKQIYTQYLKLKGNDDEDITDLLETAKNRGNLFDKAKTALDALNEHGNTLKANKEKEVRQQQQLAQQESLKVQNEVKQTINAGKLLGFELDKKTQNEFSDFLFKPVTKDGLTKSQIVDNEMSLEQELYIKYLAFKGFKVGTDIKKVTQKLDELTTRSKQAIITGKADAQTKSTNEPVRFDKIKFNELHFD